MTMPAMLTELYDALLRANVPEEQARAAAQAVMRDVGGGQAIGTLHTHIDKVSDEIRERFKAIDARFETINAMRALGNERLAKLETSVSYHKWLFGIIIALQVAILLKLIWP
jgi:hypothetical protein